MFKMRIARLLCLWGTTTLFAGMAHAAMEEPCIDPVRVQAPVQPRDADPESRGRRMLWFDFRGKRYQISNFEGQEGRNVLFLKDADGRLISQIEARQAGGGPILEFSLFDHGRIWMQGASTDYLSAIDERDGQPVLRPAQPLSMMTRGECDGVAAPDAACLPAQGSYSRALQRIFVKGYAGSAKNPQGRVIPQSRQLVRGNFVAWPKELQGSDFYRDLPGLHAALFARPGGDLLLYDGVTVRPFDLPYPRSASALLEDEMKRVFLVGFEAGEDDGGVKYVAEVRPDYSFRELKLPDAGMPSGGVYGAFLVGADRHLVFVGSHAVLYERQGSLYLAATAKPDRMIVGQTISRQPDGNLMFEVRSRKASTFFSLGFGSCSRQARTGGDELALLEAR